MHATLLCIAIEQWGSIFEIITPITLLLWFFYSDRQKLSREFYADIPGDYAGYTSPVSKPIGINGRIESALKMKILEIDSNGFFRGDFDFAEREQIPGTMVQSRRADGVYTFFGKVKFEVHKEKDRNPFVADENRIYNGTLYVVDRLDFQFEQQDIKDYTRAEFSLKYYREMKVLKFSLLKSYKDPIGLPTKFKLYKKIGLSFEPHRNISEFFRYFRM